MRERPNQGSKSRALMRWQDLTLGLAVIVACVGFFAFRSANAAPGAVAHIYLNSEEIRTVALGAEDDYRIDFLESHGVPVSFEVQGGAIRFVDVTCPDHLCERTGFVSADGQTAVCMPNRMAVVVSGETDG